MTPDKNNFQLLLDLLAKHGGTIISSNDLHPDLIKQAEASHRMYVDENNLGYVWEPPIAGRFPTTDEEVEMFEWCYPLDVEMPEGYDEKMLDKIMKGIRDTPATTTMSIIKELEGLKKPRCKTNNTDHNNAIDDAIEIVTKHTAPQINLDEVEKMVQTLADNFAREYTSPHNPKFKQTVQEYVDLIRTRIGYTLDANGKPVAIQKGGEDDTR